MAVFPENMNRLDVNDTGKSLATVERYIRYMRERIEFAMRNTSRSVGGAEESSAALARGLEELTRETAAIAGAVASTLTQLNEVKGSLGNIKTEMAALRNSMAELEERVNALESTETQS